jgi:predicted deacetylase
MKMLADAKARSIPLTLGVIPLGLNEDAELVSYLKTNACTVELGLHGFSHDGGEYEEYPEFGTSTKEEANVRILQGLDILKNITADQIVTWIPPLNEHSEGTIAALGQLGFTHLSSEGKGVFDYDAATFTYTTDSLVSPEEVIKQCTSAFKTSTYCIIMLHPQDFAEGLMHSQEKYEQYYLGLLDAFVREGVTFSRLKDIPLE